MHKTAASACHCHQKYAVALLAQLEGIASECLETCETRLRLTGRVLDEAGGRSQQIRLKCLHVMPSPAIGAF